MSLGEYGRKQAVLRASSLALHSQSFFTAIRSTMQRLTPQQIAQLVATWRDQMRQRDEDIRRRIEVGLHPRSLQRYADASEHDADVYDELLEQLVSSPAVHDESERSGPEPRPQDRERAYRAVAESMTSTDDDPDSCYLPIIDATTLAGLDQLSQLDLAKNYLIAATRLATERVDRSYRLTAAQVSTVPSSFRQSEPHAAHIPPPRSESLQTAWSAYLEDQARRKESWRGKLPEKAVLAFRDFFELIGDKPIAEVTRQDCNRFLRFQEKRPNLNVRCYRGVHATALEAADIPEDDRQSSTSAMHKVAEITRFFHWCTTEHRIVKSPAESLKVAEGEVFNVKPWSMDELRQLLDPANLRTKTGMLDPRSNVRYLPWTIVLGAYTGARLAEIVEVRLIDFKRRDEHSNGTVPVMIVDEYDDRSLKTTNARRKVPLHPDLEALGLWEYIDRRLANGETMLLDCPTKSGTRAKSASQRFTRYTQRLGLHQEREKVFHSLRHMFITKLTGEMDKTEVELVVGHARQSSTDDSYISTLDLAMHKFHAAICRLSFGLDLSRLRAFLEEVAGSTRTV